jgi:excisionase family DNA binding protein
MSAISRSGPGACAPATHPGDVDVAAVLRAHAGALRAQADAIDAQALVLDATAPVPLRAPEPAPLLSKQQIAAALGVSTATVDRLCRERAIPFVTVGDSRRFDLANVRQALEARAAEELPALPSQGSEDRPSGVRRLTRGGR